MGSGGFNCKNHSVCVETTLQHADTLCGVQTEIDARAQACAGDIVERTPRTWCL
jgi:hypothetical protein